MKNRLLGKIINGLIVTAVGIAGFWCGTYFIMDKITQGIKKWDSQYQQISNSLNQFVEVSNPETIRLYVKKLGKILKDIEFLNNLVESGQIADKALSTYENKIDDVNNRLLLFKDKSDSLKLSLTIIINDNIHRLEKEIVTNKKDVLALYLKLDNLRIKLEKLIDEVSVDIDKIKNSKYRKKIWFDN